MYEEDSFTQNVKYLLLILFIVAVVFGPFYLIRAWNRNEAHRQDCEQFRFTSINDVPASCYSYFK